MMDDSFFNTEISDHDMVVQWLNSAALSQQPSEKVDYLRKVQEFLIHKAQSLLPTFLSDVLNFASDRSSDLKRALVGFIEETCKINESLLPKVMFTLHMLLCDESIPVQKRVIQGAISIYRRTLQWLCKASVVNDEMEDAWKQLTSIKMEIANMIDSDNDGIRTSSVKFLECVVLLQTYPDQNDNRKAKDFSLEDVPLTLKLARRRKLEEEAKNIFDLLIKFNGSPHISSANLFACLGVLTNIAKTRPEFMQRVVVAIEELHSNLPPTLTSTQVNSVRKKLKSELMGLIKHAAAFEFADKITAMLMELGCNNQEITKLLPKTEDRKKYKRFIQFESMPASKRQKLDSQPDVDDETVEKLKKEALEMNEQYVLENLTLEKVVHMVVSSLPNVPNTSPPNFNADYLKHMSSGPVGQNRVIAKILATQFIEAAVGPGVAVLSKIPLHEDKKKEKDEQNKTEKEKVRKEKVKVQRIKSLKLAEITKPLMKDVKEGMLVHSIERLLLCNKMDSKQLKQKIIVTAAASFSPTIMETVLSFLLNDLRTHIDLALAWLYEEYSIMQGFLRIPALRRDSRLDQNYTNLLNSFVSASASDAIILSRIFLEAPLINETALEQLCKLCQDEHTCSWTLGLLRDLVVRRPPKQLMFLNALLSHSTHEIAVIRDSCLNHVLELHKNKELKPVIEEFARMNLEFLRLQQPPATLFGSAQGRLQSAEGWNDDVVKACLLPYMSLLPSNESLIHDLSKVYVQTNADIKRVILRLLEVPIRTMGMDSAELLKLVEECPKGAETLVTRVIHILTDKGPPSSQLVQRVRDLYHTRVSDVRFLIPVLNGLTKKEVIAALPKLIKLNPVVVREVFNRLLGLHGESPITPTELLVALHLIDISKADLKTIMKATSMCLNEKQVYTQEVLAVVLQQLMDQTPLPTLLMRTVIQALSSYPRLSGFVMNILQRLILKQVWKQKVVWEGFIKCCQRTKPQSFTVLMQLPAPQLSDALSMCPELKEPLKEHLVSFSETQRVHIPSAVQEILMGTATPAPPVEQHLPPEVPTATAVLSKEPLPPGMD